MKFIEYLKSLGYAIRSRPVLNGRNGDKYQKGVDTTLFKDAMDFILQDSVDEAILVSGDSDFTGLISVFKDSRIKVKVWSFEKSIARSIVHELGNQDVNFLDCILDEITVRSGFDM
jgi:uncharacterized LabA/DUF88 family protein